LSTKKIIVLGGAGFLGTAILKGLKNLSSTPLTSGDLHPPLLDDVNHVELDLLNGTSLKEKLTGYDVIINCVGQIASPFNLTLNLNTTGMLNLGEVVGNSAARLIHISSVSVYGSADKCDESHSQNPETSYATAKATAEIILQRYIDTPRLTILRLSNLYGSGQQKGVVAYIIRSFLSDRVLHFNNAGDLIRFYLHTEDCVATIEDFVQDSTRHGIFNVVGPDDFSIKELITTSEMILETSFESTFEQVKPWENLMSLSNDKVQLAFHRPFNWNFKKYLQMRANKLGE
jgi:nucleoside-diphosphate-sugar epimerase